VGAVEDGLPVGASLVRVEPAAAPGPRDVGEAALRRLLGVLDVCEEAVSVLEEVRPPLYAAALGVVGALALP